MRINKLALIASLSTVIGSVIPVYAAADPMLKISMLYSETIVAQGSDSFSITYEDEDGEENVLDISAASLTDDTISVIMSAGDYTITDIEYNGYNYLVQTEGYAVTTEFTITDEKDGEITLAIGADPVNDLTEDTEDVIIKQNYETVDELTERQTGSTDTEDTEDADTSDEGSSTEDSETEDTSEDESTDEADAEETEESTADEETEEEPELISENPEEEEGSETVKTTWRSLVVLGIVAAATFGGLFIAHKKGKI